MSRAAAIEAKSGRAAVAQLWSKPETLLLSGMQSKLRWPMIIISFALMGCEPSALPDKPLFVGVAETDYKQGTALIRSRLQTRFPEGSPEQKLADYLEQQGLRVDRAQREASIRYDRIPCDSQVRVDWTVGSTHSIANVDALYSDTGCP
jgi:hypothetical protein